jgi:hypothetical protein
MTCPNPHLRSTKLGPATSAVISLFSAKLTKQTTILSPNETHHTVAQATLHRRRQILSLFDSQGHLVSPCSSPNFLPLLLVLPHTCLAITHQIPLHKQKQLIKLQLLNTS